MSLSMRDFAKETNTSAATMCRFANGGQIEYATLIKILKYYDSDLAEEVELLLGYVRKAMLRRSRKNHDR